MPVKLFRQEALSANQDKLSGPTLQVRPLGIRVLSLATFSITIIAVAYMFWGEYTRKEHVSGYLVPDKGLIKVYTPQPGTIITKHVQEGQNIGKGEALFTITSERSIGESQSAESTAITLLKERRDSLKIAQGKQESIDSIEQHDLKEKISSVVSELTELDDQYRTQLLRVESAKATVNRYQQLVSAKFVSEVQLQQQMDMFLEQKSKLLDITRGRISLKRDLDTFRQSLASAAFKNDNQRLSTTRGVQEVDQQIAEYEARRTITIMAPQDGQVSSVMTKLGQQASIGIPLVSILPKGAKLQAELLIPTRAAGFIRLGQAVSLRYGAYPYQRFGSHDGSIVAIDRTVIDNSDSGALPVSIQEPVYRVTVALKRQNITAYGIKIPLQAGMLLDADIAIDRRNLIDWILDPVYSITGKI
jgi:membrane fusion protein